MFLVIRIHALPFLKDPFDHLIRRCLDDSRKNRLSVFQSEALAESYIKKQQIMTQQHFMLLTMTSLLLDTLTVRQARQFFNPLHHLTYYAPRSQSGRHIQFHHDFSGIHEQDQDFIYQQQLALHQQQHRTSLPHPVVLKSAQEIPFQSTLPSDFNLVPEIQQSLQNGTFSDPVTSNAFKDIKNVACVKLSNGYFSVYDRDTLFTHYHNNSEDHVSFKDPYSGLRVSIKAVFSISPASLQAFVNKPERNPAPALSDTPMVEMTRRAPSCR